MAGRVKGATSLKRLLRKLPDEVRKELADELQAGGVRMLRRARAETPVRYGGLRNALSIKVAAKTLMLQIGLTRKIDQRRHFYGYILDQGRAAKTVTIKRGPRAGSVMRISPISAARYEFVFGRRQDFKDNEVPRLRQVLDRVLKRVARGSGND